METFEEFETEAWRLFGSRQSRIEPIPVSREEAGPIVAAQPVFSANPPVNLFPQK